MSDTIFGKIINREIDADIVHEDEQCLAFRDINPQAPMHILVIPKKPIPRLADATAEDRDLLGHMMLKAADIAREEGYGDAFRLAMNNGEAVGQSVFHLHLHILGGRSFSWPPGGRDRQDLIAGRPDRRPATGSRKPGQGRSPRARLCPAPAQAVK